MKLGADPDFQDLDGMTALHYVLKKRRDKEFARVLVRYGDRCDIANGSGITAAEIMLRKRHPDYREMATHLPAEGGKAPAG